MTVVVPVLGGSNWTTEPTQILKTMFAYTISSQHSQSDIYNGKITSIPYLIKQYETSSIQLANELERTLMKYFIKAFDNANVTVSYDQNDVTYYQLSISVDVTANSKSYSLAFEAQVDNGILKKTLQAINS